MTPAWLNLSKADEPGLKALSWGARLLLRAALVAAVLAAVSLSGGIARLDDRLTDGRFKLATRPPGSSLVMVDIDAKSLADIGVWPWERTIHARLVQRLVDLGIRQIAFDIDFSARSSPNADAAFARQIAAAKVPVFLATFVQTKAAGEKAFLFNRPIDLLAANGWPALVNVPVDADGRVRQFPAQLTVNGETLDSLPALIAGAVGGGAPVVIDYSIDHHGFTHVSASDVLYGQVDPATMAGKTALIGAAAQELHDFFQVPRWGIVTGGDIVALASETLIEGRGLHRLPKLPILLPLLAIALLASRLPTLPALASLVALSLLTEAAAALLQVAWADVLETASLQVAVLTLLALSLMREYDLRGVLLRVARLEKANADRILGRVFDNGFDGIVIIDEDDRIIRHNLSSGGFLAVPGATEPTLPLLPRKLRQAVAKVRASAGAQSRFVDIEQPEDAAEAEIFECAVTAFAVEPQGFRRGKAESYVCITLRNVTERRRAAERIRHMALHDALTGLMNRAGLLESMQGSGKLICWDIRRFGKINDGLGNAVGDQVLIEVGRRVSALSMIGARFARIGSDEFALFLCGEDRQAEAAVDAVRAALAEVFLVGGHRLFVEVDFGIAADAEGADPLLSHANLALAKSKRDDGAVVVYDASLEHERQNRLALEEDLRLAIERGELTAFYQPQVALDTLEIVGAEMLVRWQHPTRGMIAPLQFIPIAEETGLIHQLTAWAIRQSCQDAAAWPKPLRVAVNVSAIDLGAGDLRQMLKSALELTGLAPGRLDIELTESFLLERSDAVNCTLTAIRALGVGIALDDFGTGYSSLAYLSRLPFTKLKMDKAFVDDIATSRDALALAEGIIRLAHSLRLQVVAEGIETIEQREALAGLGCDIGQGYLFARPMPQGEMMGVLRGVGVERVG